MNIGLGLLVFKAKGDLKDANGNSYYNWSDGKLYNIPENSPNAASAIVLTRDYTYETDLRDVDIDGVGKYRQYSLTIPFEIGLKKTFNKYWSAKVGFQYIYTFTDYIDNVSSVSLGARKGDKGTDKLMTASIGVTYNFHFKKLTAADIAEMERKKAEEQNKQPVPQRINSGLPDRFAKYDLNKNGKIDKAEIDKAIELYFDSKNTNATEIEDLVKYFHSQK